MIVGSTKEGDMKSLVALRLSAAAVEKLDCLSKATCRHRSNLIELIITAAEAGPDGGIHFPRGLTALHEQRTEVAA
jgi:hypothetical protein